MTRRRNIYRVIIITSSVLLVIVVSCNLWVMLSTRNYIYHSTDEVPFNYAALVLGTSKYSRDGHSNLFFKYRMEAASRLYAAGKVKHFILSGDNSLSYYNEPQDMRKALMLQGIPDSAITPDYAGFRTFDSVVRSKKIFRQDSITIITQEFHAYRALFISNFYGMKAIAFATEPVPKGYSLMTHLRECFARCVAVVDLYILRKEPKFLGDQIDINN